MPAPGEHKTIQARILAYAQEIGWRFGNRSGTLFKDLKIRAPRMPSSSDHGSSPGPLTDGRAPLPKIGFKER
jgi:hypothetical protein